MQGSVRRARTIALVTTAAFALLGSSAHAAITSPPSGSVQRGDVTLTEAPGASVELFGSALVQYGCKVGAKSELVVKDAGGNVVFGPVSKTSGALSPDAGLGPLTAVWETKDVSNGTYTVTSTVNSRVRNTSISCKNAPTTSSATFELRKWQHRFDDARGKGTVSFNTSPKELQVRLGTQDTGVRPGTGLEVVRLPKSTTVPLPEDPAACLADAATCVPTTPASCDADPASCEERLVVADVDGGRAYGLHGLFDLRTKAFTALASVDGTSEVLTNVGNACGDISDQLADAGLDVDGVLGGTPVDATLPVELGQPKQVPTTAGALCALAQSYAVAAVAGATEGTGIGGTPELNAGALLLHIATKTTSGKPEAPSALPYAITTSTTVPPIGALPKLPEVPLDLPLPELPAGTPSVPTDPAGLIKTLAPKGPLTQVKGSGFSGTHLAGGLNVDTAPGPEGGDPFWLPLRSAKTLPDSRIDFVGYGTAEQGETCFSILGTETCIGIGLLLGQGAAVFGPAPLSLPVIP